MISTPLTVTPAANDDGLRASPADRLGGDARRADPAGAGARTSSTESAELIAVPERRP